MLVSYVMYNHMLLRITTFYEETINFVCSSICIIVGLTYLMSIKHVKILPSYTNPAWIHNK